MEKQQVLFEIPKIVIREALIQLENQKCSDQGGEDKRFLGEREEE